MNPCASYRAAVREALPNARIVADHFHLLDVGVRGHEPAYDSESHYLRLYLAQLRRKLELEPSRPWQFTEPRLGFRLVP